MKLHTNLSATEVRTARIAATEAGEMTPDVHFVQFVEQASRSHPHGYLIQLGTYDKTTGPTRSRHYKNSGGNGAASELFGCNGAVWAATYDEWGWFVARIFAADPAARFGGYRSRDDFNVKTGYKYTMEGTS